MSIREVVSGIVERLRLRRGSDRVLPQDEFRRVLERERALADRHDLKFCLLVFSRNGSACSLSALKTVAENLTRQLRNTDVAGWMEGDRIGTILRFATPEGARLVGERVTHLMPADLPHPKIEVLSYPEAEDTVAGGNPPPPSVPSGTPPSSRSGERQLPMVAPAPQLVESTASSATPDPSIDELLTPPFPAWKRVSDILISSALLVILSPIMLGVSLLIKIVSPGPALFKQERIGYRRRKFQCWKFRTMYLHADVHLHEDHFIDLMAGDKAMKKLDCTVDPRVIPFGRFLRASGLDELPQLFNVLRGDMSFIGPRPCIEYEFARYKRWQRSRFDTRPGLTGLWQVSGKNRTTFSQMMRMDISYSRDRSLWKDLFIILRTVPAVINEVRDTFGFGKRPSS